MNAYFLYLNVVVSLACRGVIAGNDRNIQALYLYSRDIWTSRAFISEIGLS